MKVLQLNSSLSGDNSFSTKYANRISEKLKNAGASVEVKDLEKDPLPLFTSEVLGALFSGNMEHSVVKEYTKAINQLLETDTLVLAVPMYNFSIPTQLKNYFDGVARAGVTFKYSETGVVGLTNIQKAYVVLSRGGNFKDLYEAQEKYIEQFLKFIGVKEVQFIFIEGLARGEESVNASVEKIENEISAMVI